MSVRSGQAITIEFVTSSPTTQAATNADSLPVGTLVVNGADNGASVTVTNVDTGRYKAAVTLPTLAVGDVVEISVAATVTSVAGKAVVWRDTKDVVIDSAGLVDALAVKVGPTGSGVAQTGGDLFTSVTNIAVTSAALNIIASAATITTGTETNTYTSTSTADGVYHSVADTAGTTDFYYQFDLSGTSGAVGVGVAWSGYVVGVVNTLKVYAYNWVGITWDQIGTIVGIAGTTNMSEEWEITSSHTGTGGNLGLVRVRFSNTGLTTSSTKTDRILLGYAVVPTFPSNFSSLGINASGHLSRVTLVDTITNYTGNTPQTGDVFPLVSTEIADIKTKTDNLPSDPADASDIASAFATVNITLATIAGYIDNEVGSIKTVTDKLDTTLEVDGDVYRYTSNALEQTPTGGSAPTVEEIRTEIDSNSTQLAAIIADTNELQTDWANGGRLDNILDARSSQMSVDDLPTNSELAIALDTVLSAIADLNNITVAAVAAQITSDHGLGSYLRNTEPPTAAENATATNQYDHGNGRTTSYFLQGGSNKIDFADDGLLYTVYTTDDVTILYVGTSTRLAATVGGLKSVDPG